MKEILYAVGTTLEVMLSFFVQLATLPCELLNISDYWAIAYTPIIIVCYIAFRRKP